MYQDIIDDLVLPFGVDKVQGFLTEGNRQNSSGVQIRVRWVKKGL